MADTLFGGPEGPNNPLKSALFVVKGVPKTHKPVNTNWPGSTGVPVNGAETLGIPVSGTFPQQEPSFGLLNYSWSGEGESTFFASLSNVLYNLAYFSQRISQLWAIDPNDGNHPPETLIPTPGVSQLPTLAYWVYQDSAKIILWMSAAERWVNIDGSQITEVGIEPERDDDM